MYSLPTYPLYPEPKSLQATLAPFKHPKLKHTEYRADQGSHDVANSELIACRFLIKLMPFIW